MDADVPDISLPQLRCFLAVVEAGSLAQAGRRLGMSAASVSKTLSRLEASIGLRLLHRSTHALSLTGEGEALLDSASAVLPAARDFRDVAGGAAGADEAGTVRISAPVGLARSVLAPLLARFRAGGSTRYLPDAALVFDDGDGAWLAATSGAGIACAPLWLAAEALRNGTMVELLRHRRGEPVNVAAIRRERRLTPTRVAALLGFLSERAPDYGDL